MKEIRQVFRRDRNENVIGVYRGVLDQQTVLAAAQNGTSTGYLWAYVPLGTVGKRARVRRLRADSQHSTALPTPTAPRLRVARFTYSGGAASGAQVTTAKIAAAADAPSPVLDLRTAMTGLTGIALVAALDAVALCGALTAVGAYTPAGLECFPLDTEDEWPVLEAGNGIVVYQDTAGTASDTRKFNLTLAWDEIDVS